jgi:preprotein translocase subunit SecA
VHFLEQSLRAHALYQRDKDYIVRDGEVIIVDEFTGRVMPGRRWSEGLHQAVEAKEGVKMQAESRTLATITFQNYFRMYGKLSGMTGTAATSAEEFHKVYGLNVIVVPTSKPIVRRDEPDVVFRTLEGKWRALVMDVKQRYERGQPVLIGTTSIEKNELVSKLLEREGITHEVLNAKQHAREGEIIAQAGRLGAVTVATNMAGRGVDIMLGGTPQNPEQADAVRAAGGLAVLGTERHEARRIDNQLRGRSGRQGDPGETQFYISLEDDLMRIFGGDKLQSLMARLNVPEDQPIESGIVSKALEGAQARIEGQNFDIRKHLLDYDDVVNKHREAVYRRRRELLLGKEYDAALVKLFTAERDAVMTGTLASDLPSEWDREGLLEHLKTILFVPDDAAGQLDAIVDGDGGVDMKREAVAAWLDELYEKGLTVRQEELGEEEAWTSLRRQALLRSIDTLWMEHLETMDALRDSVRLRAYGQRDPLVEYKAEASRLFRELEASIRIRTLQYLFRAHVHKHGQHVGQQRNQQMNRADQPVAGPVRAKAEVGRNDPCPCGSGLKYKKCGMINAPEHRGS